MSHYKKAAVMQTGIIPQSEVQMNLFDQKCTQKQFKLMESMDKINSKYGRNHMAFGLHKKGTNKK